MATCIHCEETTKVHTFMNGGRVVSRSICCGSDVEALTDEDEQQIRDYAEEYGDGKNSESSKGRTTVFGAVNEGSIPSSESNSK